MRSVLRRLLAFDREVEEGLAIRGLIAGVDEVGVGPLAGPVVAAAVIFIRPFKHRALNDSKQVLPQIREILFREISKHSLIGIGVASEAEIDALNIYHASRLAMKRALLSLPRTPDFVLLDGRGKVDLPLPQKAVVEGDAKSACIAAASIVAKVHRDAWMVYLDSLYPDYQFRRHKGYATKGHIEKLREKGPSPVHRKSFAPVQIPMEETVL